MRFFLRIRQDGVQIGRRRVQSKHDITTTDELLSFVCRVLSLGNLFFIVTTIVQEQHKLKIIKGWTLQHYRLKSGQLLEVEVSTGNKPRSQKLLGRKQLPIFPAKQQMAKITEEREQEQANCSEISDLATNKYEQLLKLIQKNDAESYMKHARAKQTSLGECENELYKKLLIEIQKQLGMEGWGAIHYAVFVGNIAIVRYLISIGVNINLKTFDEWLPIQIAINQKNMPMIELLVSQPSLNINICTTRGLPLNMAVKAQNAEIVEKLLTKEVNFSIKDHVGRTALDIVDSNPNKRLKDMLERAQSPTIFTKNIMYHSLITLFRGEVLLIKAPPWKDRIAYLCLNPYQRQVKIYENKQSYPQNPKEKFDINETKIKAMEKSEQSWYMKDTLKYLNVVLPSLKIKYVFGCHYQQTVKRWVSGMNECLKFIDRYPDISKYKPNQTVVADLIEQQIPKKKPSTNNINILNIFTNKVGQETPSKLDRQHEKNNNLFDLKDTRPSSKEKDDRQDIKESEGKAGRKEGNERYIGQSTRMYQEGNKKNGKMISCREQLEGKQLKRQNSEKYNTNGKQEKKAINGEEEQNPEKRQQKKTDPQRHPVNNNNNGSNERAYNFSDFSIIKLLGKGSFGTVILVTDLHSPAKKKYALKTFKKATLMKNRQVKYIICELTILKQVSHPFIINLRFTFQTMQYVYMGLDYCPNRDLSHHLINEVTFPEADAMFYTAEVLLALQYLHERHNIIYRDLKPENIMLDELGHVKLVDFGLSKQGEDDNFLAKSFCGSPAYLSPEMLKKKGVGKQSDFYCLGAVLYEMVFGEPPFFSEDAATLYNNINSSELTFPGKVSKELEHLLKGLLERNPQKRLGFKSAQEIKSHSFFKHINWCALEKRQVSPPVRGNPQPEEQDEPFSMQSLHPDCDYPADRQRVNRFLNFSFVREDDAC